MMRYSKINSMDISNGENIGVAIFVQGCHFHCKGCFNQETWDFNGGKEWNRNVEKQFIELISKPYIKRVSILGGEPLADENLDLTIRIINITKEHKPNISIWIYTGYTFEKIKKDFNAEINNLFNDVETKTQLLEKIGIKRFRTVLMCQYLVDGQFEIDKQDLTYSKVKFAGSTNQRVIDIATTMNSEGDIILYE